MAGIRSEIRGTPRGVLFLIARLVLGVALFPAITILAALGLGEFMFAFGLSKSYELASAAFCTIGGAMIGAVVSVYVVRRSGFAFSSWREAIRPRLREPMASCLEFGFLGALISGGVLLSVIFLLGHARPAGWDLDRVLPTMGFGFILFSAVGLRLGLARRRKGGSSVL